jgi:hypothetical protein
VGNIGPLTFGQDDNQMLLVDAKGEQELPRASKLLDPRMADQLPAYATPGSAGLDLRACLDAP